MLAVSDSVIFRSDEACRAEFVAEYDEAWPLTDEVARPRAVAALSGGSRRAQAGGAARLAIRSSTA